MILFTVLFGAICRFYVIPSFAKESESSSSTEITEYQISPEDQETLDQIFSGNPPDLKTPEDTEKLLNATGAWLKANAPDSTETSSEDATTEVATSTDAEWDPRPYLTYPLDQRWIEDSDTVQKGLDDIYRMLLSIRNIVLVFFGGCFLVWCHKTLKGVVYRLNGRGLK